MSYLSFTDRKAKEVSVLAKVTRKRRFDGSSLVFDGGESKYYLSFALGEVASVAICSQATSEVKGRTELAAETALGAVGPGEYFVDTTQNRIYFGAFLDAAGDTFASDTSATLVVEYWIYLSSADVGWFSTPTDDTAAQVHWAGCITEAPQIRKSVADNYAGFAPVEISPLKIAWHNTDLFENAYSDSYADCSAIVWVCFGILEVTRIKKIFTGRISGVQITDTEMSFNLAEDAAFFDRKYLGRYFQDETTLLNPNDVGRAIPILCGVTEWIKCTNIDYISTAPTTSDNRIWAVHDFALGGGEITFTLTGATLISGTTYSVTMSAASGALMLGEQLVRKTVGGNWVNLVQSGGVFEMNTGGAFVPANGQVFTRPPVQEFYFQVPSKNDAVTNWLPSTHASASSTVSGGCVCVILTSAFESIATALGITTIDPNDFEVWARCIGPGMDQTLNAAYFEGDHQSEVGALLWYLKNAVGLAETEINVSSFTTALAGRPPSTTGINEAALINPLVGTDFETHRDIVGRMLRQIGAIGYFDVDGKFAIKVRDSLAAADWTLTEAEIDAGSLAFELDPTDQKSFQIDGSSDYIGSEFTTTTAKPSTTATRIMLANGPVGPIVSTPEGFTWKSAPVETVSLYDIGKNVQSGGAYVGRAAIDRLSAYYGNRRGLLSLRAMGEIVDAEPGDTVSVSRDILPGFAYVPGTSRTRSFFILDVRRNADSVELLLEDQYSIEEVGGF